MNKNPIWMYRSREGQLIEANSKKSNTFCPRLLIRARVILQFKKHTKARLVTIPRSKWSPESYCNQLNLLFLFVNYITKLFQISSWNIEENYWSSLHLITYDFETMKLRKEKYSHRTPLFFDEILRKNPMWENWCNIYEGLILLSNIKF